MLNEKSIFYILIGTYKKPLASYCRIKSEEITSQAESFLNKGFAKKEINRTKFNNYCIFSQEVNNITYIVLTSENFSLTAGASCVESLIKEIGPLLEGRNFKKIKKYGLNDELSAKIKMKFEFFNKNTDYISEEHYNLRKELLKQKEVVFKVAENYNERGDILNDLIQKQKDLEDEQYSYAANAKKIREQQCLNKTHLITYIVLGAIILGLIILIIVLATKK